MRDHALVSQVNSRVLVASAIIVVGLAVSIQMLNVSMSTQTYVAIVIAGVSVALAVLLLKQSVNTLLARLQSVESIISAIENNDASLLNNHFKAEHPTLFRAVATFLNNDIANDKEHNHSLLLALKVCQANIMLADASLNIVYLNDSLTSMLRKNQAKLQQELPGFNVDNLIGANIDSFHRNPSHQRGILANLSRPYVAQIIVAGLTFDLIATPVFDEEGKRLATLVEWKDLTRELEVEKRQAELASHNARISSALDVCQANVMLADDKLNIVYVNDSVVRMLRDNQPQLRKSLPNFDVDKLVGQCIDVFHENPSHQRHILDKLNDVYRADIEIAGFTFGLIATPVFDDGGKRIGTVVEWEDKTDRLNREALEKAAAAENLRVRRALDNVSTNTMIANEKFEIVYLNRAVKEMMRGAESDLKRDLPNFDSRQLMGANIDVFHKNPSHQRSMLSRLESEYKTEIAVGGRTFSLVANPIFDSNNERVGTVVEWNDRTKEVQIEKEVAGLVQSANSGNLSVRLSDEGKEGFYLRLAQGLNSLVATVDETVTDMGEMLDSLATGNLTQRIEGDYRGAYEKLKKDANTTAEKLTEVLGRIRTSANLVASGAEEISQGNADLSQRTEEQASSLEETASSMEEMTSTVRQNADNAKVANQLAEETCDKATKGGEVVTRAVESMSEINSSSKKIADIIGVIDEIAFQTNLLALNAAVEAARAGEQGRGFAVVAGEVRNLAQRSAAAAKEIKDLIRDSVSKVEDGTLLVNESGETLKGIVESVKRVTNMISDIAEASVEQSSGIEQVNKAVSQMDEMTQQNAALVEEASAAGESMAEQANDMRRLLNFFTLDDLASHSHDVSSSKRHYDIQEKQPPKHTMIPSKTSLQNTKNNQFADDSEEWEEF
ncbi:PAS domain-containing protein [Pseudoalteromonas sp. McH1-7]|uniref:methyl-accepting chemotaxis protein n=1 Tax=Pseudoalteromonas TaxID=53246 RepID=UPI001590A8C1|nr:MULTISPECIES: methyl-accepting chemotaxis protein [Pseudoalteromonas]MDW7551454.1 methyl-accepting chemotaxis protein [Pseudoalteromonas peptidolytica]NUZ13014.1 PAS domain-containing protein [Pseudoalteromonas sp. McH1-7]USD28844.1 PAS domain-containing protein [Pseudoalteromonas sp. SCSIO 43201]